MCNNSSTSYLPPSSQPEDYFKGHSTEPQLMYYLTLALMSGVKLLRFSDKNQFDMHQVTALLVYVNENDETVLAFRARGIVYSNDSGSRNKKLTTTASKLEAIDYPEETNLPWCLILFGSQDLLTLYHMEM